MGDFSSRFVWHQLLVGDPAKAKAFYAAVFGWRYRIRREDGGEYAVIRHGRREIGGIAGLAGLPFNQAGWYPIAACLDLAGSLGRARELGGETVLEPVDLGEIGWIAVMCDPQGALVMLLAEELPADGGGRSSLPGTFYWDELATPDPRRARDFYCRLLGWRAHDHDMGAVGTYTIFRDDAPGTKDAAGMHALPADGLAKPHWTGYLSVASCADTIERVLELDGRVAVPPTTIPGIGRFAMLHDSQHVLFAIIEVGSDSRVATTGQRRQTGG